MGCPLLVTLLRRQRSRHGLSVDIIGGVSPPIEALDGSTNAAHGIGWYACSVCAVDAEGARAAVVANLVAGTRFVAVRGEGATVDGRSLAPTTVTDISDAIVGLSGYPAKHLGFRQFRAMVTDAAGNHSETAAISVTIDTVNPAAGTLSFSNLTDTGSADTPPVTTDNAFDLTLTGQEAGTTVVYQKSTDGGATWTTSLSSAAVLFGIGLPDENAHAPNEKLDLSNFHNYRILRVDEAPPVEVHLVPGGGKIVAHGVVFNTFGPRMRPADGRAIPTFISQALSDSDLKLVSNAVLQRWLRASMIL